MFQRAGRAHPYRGRYLHNHCFSEQVARTHTEDGNGRKANKSIVYTILMPLSRRGAEILSPEERMAVVRLGVLQLLKGGATTVMEPFRAGIPGMFDAAAEMGIRFYGAPYVFSTADARAGADGVVHYAGDDGQAGLADWKALYDKWNRHSEGRLRLAMAPHATDTCGPDLLRACAAIARERGVPLTTHVAQGPDETATIATRHDGRTPAEYLDWLGPMAPDLLAAHCIASTDEDLRLMAARGATVLNCPRVFARSGTVASFAGFGVRSAIGTDGYNLDLLGELNAASTISKIVAGRADVATAPALTDAVTTQAAAAIGRPDLGTLSPGTTADITVVDLSDPMLRPIHDPRRGPIALATRANIDLVVVDGQIRIADGCYRDGDEDAIAAAGSAAIRKIRDLPEARAAFDG